MAAFSAARAAYRKGSFTQDIDFTEDSNWADYNARMLRYAVMSQYVSGNPYDQDTASWARAYKAQHGLYQYTRPIANPVYQVAEFYRTYLWGGRLSLDASDDPNTALPIVNLANESYRPYIAQVFNWSNWSTRRHQVPASGAVMGDAFIQVIDDQITQKVYLKVTHASKFEELDKDPFGNIKGYKISYQRTDDINEHQEVVYTETCERDDNGMVVYKLYKNGNLYPWDNAVEPEWTENYGFIPAVHIQHRETSYGWGEPELYPRLPLIRELDDQYSLLNDQIRKTVNAPWIVSGETARSFTESQFTDPTTARPLGAREEALMLFLANPDSNMMPMVTNLPINEVRENIAQLQRLLEDSYPELALTRIKDIAQASGVTVRRLQQPAENKILAYRDVYDGALVKAVQMALTIGGMRGIFGGINESSYASGALDFTIGKRPVFSTDPMDDIEIKQAQAEALSTMANVGNINAAVEYVYGEDSQLVNRLNQVDIVNAEPIRGAADVMDTPETLASDKGLNGAQINAAVELLAGVADGTVAELNAVELLTSLGIEKERAQRMATAAKSQKTIIEVENNTGFIDR
jgi:hypothetical protein